LLLYSSHLPLGVPNGLVIQLGTSYFLAPSTSFHARRFEEEHALETFGGNRDGLCGAECFSLLIHSTPLPKGIKLSDNIVKFNGQQDPRIWLDDFITTVTIGGGSRDNALQLFSLHLKDNVRAWLNNLAPDSIRSWEGVSTSIHRKLSRHLTMAHVVQRIATMRTEDWRKPKVVHLTMD
jgi:hypothetical protein